MHNRGCLLHLWLVSQETIRTGCPQTTGKHPFLPDLTQLTISSGNVVKRNIGHQCTYVAINVARSLGMWPTCQEVKAYTQNPRGSGTNGPPRLGVSAATG